MPASAAYTLVLALLLGGAAGARTKAADPVTNPDSGLTGCAAVVRNQMVGLGSRKVKFTLAEGKPGEQQEFPCGEFMDGRCTYNCIDTYESGDEMKPPMWMAGRNSRRHPGTCTCKLKKGVCPTESFSFQFASNVEFSLEESFEDTVVKKDCKDGSELEGSCEFTCKDSSWKTDLNSEKCLCQRALTAGQCGKESVPPIIFQDGKAGVSFDLAPTAVGSSIEVKCSGSLPGGVCNFKCTEDGWQMDRKKRCRCYDDAVCDAAQKYVEFDGGDGYEKVKWSLSSVKSGESVTKQCGGDWEGSCQYDCKAGRWAPDYNNCWCEKPTCPMWSKWTHTPKKVDFKLPVSKEGVSVEQACPSSSIFKKFSDTKKCTAVCKRQGDKLLWVIDTDKECCTQT